MADTPSESGAHAQSDRLEKLQKLKEAEATKYAGHEFDDDGWHDDEECRVCQEAQAVICSCKCGECCRRLLIEVDLEDAAREPKIAEKGSPIYQDARLTASGEREMIGYLLNRQEPGNIACVFLDEETNQCTIHPTRPLGCRLFDCDGEGRDKLIELGILRQDR